MVDDVKSKATPFSSAEPNFVRVSTKAVDMDQKPAVGTSVDPKGAAMSSLKANHAFSGVAEIFCKPYFTAYKPLVDMELSSASMAEIASVNVREELSAAGSLMANLRQMRRKLRNLRNLASAPGLFH